MGVITVVLVVGAIGLSCLYWYKRKRKQNIFKQMGIKGPEPNFLFGNLHQLGEEKLLYQRYREWTKQYGKVYGYYEGSTPVLVTSDLEILKQVFIKQFSNFHGRKLFPLQPHPDTGRECHMLLTRGDRWKRLRTIINPTFSASKMKQMCPLVNKCVDVFMEKIEEERTNTTDVDLTKLTKRLTMDVISECAFGVEIQCQQQPNHPFLQRSAKLFEIATERPFLLFTAILFPELSRFWWGMHQLMGMFREDAFKWLAQQLEEVINLRRKDQNHRRVDLLQLMIDAEKYPIHELRTSQLTMTSDQSSSTEDKRSRSSSSDFNCNRYSTPNGYTNGHVNGYVSEHQTLANGHTNGHLNGHLNGASNGHKNGLNGYKNGASNGHVNGITNGHVSGVNNGHVNGTTTSLNASTNGINEERGHPKNGVTTGPHSNVNFDLSDEVFDEKKPTKSGLTKEEIKNQSVLFLLAGYETSNTLMQFLLYELAMNPSIQDKLLAEIDEQYEENEVPTYETVTRLIYLDMVISETSRLYPISALFISRRCMESCVVSGISIPEGVTVQADVWSIHRDPDVWGDNPDTFDPERFSLENKVNRHPLAWIPFGAGPRNCVGMRFALMEMKITLVRMLQKYTINKSVNTPEKLTLREGGAIVPLEHIVLSMERRRRIPATD
ncbi:cytochrome P450 3A29 [Lingula anatina]|uniref:Cytochrome P450 3A29 n=1 Tax=Lingula anatina TaxID=7574 RepID=A0A1S3JZI4_LINAN|nr:cytochrome P450 3A29 [Lingula anatina]XP_013415693.1 cytochrome P450 3A29 [Lingula anatina]XP_013415694.1 cytochrome P450 3A29 [Lingula anatina]XP_013415695.1 cytochrome P450 3A29 [Lingula anatina]XP_013415696.1 cytochrome P450 3A29 [Lingula anatina]XP_013415697.1 cytochrome P450 3A29 [Lingula anatina]|eukprot:XP_013415692.1 cytochrome P450 3A29 [Lingula anatina]